MGEIFTFIGLINSNHEFIIGAHIVLVGIIILILAKLATKSMQLVPHGVQNIMEIYLEGVISMGKDVIGAELARKYLPLIATIGLLVFFGNVIGIIPGFESPTSNVNMTLVLALVVFIYYNYEGIRVNGFIKYFGHFMGPMKILAPLMFPIEIVSHFSRIVSLSFRLFGNIKGDDMFLMVILMLAPWVAPMVPFGLLAFMAVLQAFIFMILTYVYLASAIQISDH
ncbi:MAG: F0F1 ATP synthase subunit A [Sulfurospirillum sp.]|nr:F0F1 ATP synthase subunit A [Sulfurospirillum sp.]MBL0703228.1 F0F1 ATP synthase subunit A [Sulfurospirillum sp.]